MATFIGKGRLFISKGDDFVPIALAEWPTVGEITISGTIEMDAENRRNLLVWWIMLDALATAHRILD